MRPDELRVDFVTNVLIPLCEQEGKSARTGYHVYEAAYREHRAQNGSLALSGDRQKRMMERVDYMMMRFYQWLYE